MFYSIDSFLNVWDYEAAATQKILDALTDESLNQAVAAEHRTLGRLAWHIVCTTHEMMSRTGLRFDAPDEGESAPTSARFIADSFRQSSEAFVAAIKEQWNDSSLLEENDMYGFTWKNGYTLFVLLTHLIHHRGQMTVLMRQAGLKVPGIYGPSREEWSQMGMEAPAI
ncbi:hypothetical protein G3578_15300 [Brevibacillus sp. SYP-B805]|uniref:DinB family protein n=1 Tax=Brevibacillus sp. SYP-B805 TaxID=1578199 RepID=UPI0013EBC2F1|nr:DinB family protein [Brevibacillus sp. SYP-B805]NGQ96528.1 hypothetical protein [Brevibacillus sp. SYP-B805]